MYSRSALHALNFARVDPPGIAAGHELGRDMSDALGE
jgi:hypothetical protein